MMNWNGGWAWWQTGLMWLGMLVLLVVLLGGVYALVTGQPASRNRDGEDPKRILDARLARGEIDIDEYERLRKLLADAPAPKTAVEDGQHAGHHV